ncbi:uncharacterized protein FIBRA_01322 [Fibroporia radiculosa]|uniref:Uncharacterized protein n=1 Tax=Fibroporia radiculosa TaxID=599839 RepID=J4I8F2_9APHY|nr:uncharacterized protein FIBRA_01322 [Fibroporia radiculosa]CCL99306.1 predicted protein [Fibroporia radiculosa]
MLGLALSALFDVLPWTTAAVSNCPAQSCKGVGIFEIAAIIINMGVNAVVASLVVRAISEGNRILFTITLALGVTPIVANLYSNVAQSFAVDDDICVAFGPVYVACKPAESLARLAIDCPPVDVVTRICATGCDLMAVFTAWKYLHHPIRHSYKSIVQPRIKLANLVLRDGKNNIFCVVLALFNVVSGICNFYYYSSLWASMSLLPMLLFPMSSIVMSRLLLHIWEIVSKSGYYDTQAEPWLWTSTERISRSIAFAAPSRRVTLAFDESHGVPQLGYMSVSKDYDSDGEDVESVLWIK